MASERDIINTLIAEALGEGPEGMRRVAETINNRALIRGMTPEQVVTQPNQYAGYSNPGPAAVRAMADPNAISAAEAAWQLAQQPGDPTNGADHYFNPNVVRPSWAQSMTPTGDYGGHSFFSSRAVPQQPKVAPTPAAASTALNITRSNTSPSGGNTALQSALERLATVKANRVTPQSRSMQNGDPGTAVPIDVVATIPTNKAAIADASRRAALTASSNQTYAGQSGYSGPIGNPPATRTVQSVAMPATSNPVGAVPARPISYTPKSDAVGSMPTAAQFGNALSISSLPNQAQLAAATGFRAAPPVYGPRPAIKATDRLPVSAPLLEPTSVGMPRTPLFGDRQSYAGQDRITPRLAQPTPVTASAMLPMPIARPSNGGLISSGLIAPMPAPRSQMNMARNGSWNGNVLTPPQGRPISPEFLAQAATRRPIAQALMAPAPVAAPTLRVVVNGGNPIAQALSPVQQSAEWQRVTGTEPRYTDDGNGTKTDASGGKYYDRNYK